MDSKLVDGIPKDLHICNVRIADRAPKTMGKFRLYEGYWHNASVVVKTLHSFTLHDKAVGSSQGPETSIRFVGEMLKLSAHRHPHVIRTMGVCLPEHFQQSGNRTKFKTPGIVMEQLPCTLCERIALPLEREPALSRLGGVRVAMGIASGLEYLHARGFIHRNVCTKTVILTSLSPSDCMAKLWDFRLACARSHASPRAGTSQSSTTGGPAQRSSGGAASEGAAVVPALGMEDEMGERNYQAPELAVTSGTPEQQRLATPQHDVYAFGITMAAVCTRKEPGKEDAAQCHRRALERMGESNKPHPLHVVTGKCVQIEAAMRPSAFDLGHSLSLLLEGLKVEEAVTQENDRLVQQRTASQMDSLRRECDTYKLKANLAYNDGVGHGQEKRELLVAKLEEAERANQQVRVQFEQDLAAQKAGHQQARVQFEQDLAAQHTGLTARMEEEKQATQQRAEEALEHEVSQYTFRAAELTDELRRAKAVVEEKDRRVQALQAELALCRRQAGDEQAAMVAAGEADRDEAEKKQHLLYSPLRLLAVETKNNQVKSASAASLVIGPSLDGQFNRTPKWRTIGALPVNVVEISRNPCVHHGQIFTAAWKKTRGKYSASIYKALVANPGDWTEGTHLFHLPDRLRPMSCQIELVSFGKDLYRVLCRELAQPSSIVVAKYSHDRTQQDPWQGVASLPTGRAHFGVGLVGDHLLIIGGTTGRQWLGSSPDLTVTSLDLTSLYSGTGKWSNDWPVLPMKCCWPNVLVCGDHLYLLSGVYSSDGKPLPTVLSLDLSKPPGQQAWTSQELAASRIKADCGGVALEAAGCVVLAGGLRPLRFGLSTLFNAAPTPHSSLDLYLIKEKEWFSLPDIQHARCGCSLVAANGKLICFGGKADFKSEYHGDGQLVREIEVLSW